MTLIIFISGLIFIVTVLLTMLTEDD